MGDNASAERELKKVSSSGDKDLAALAKFALASVYRKENRPKDAIDLYKQLAEKPTATVGKSMAQFELAALYQEQNQPQEAKRIYEQLQKDNPNTDVASIASSKLAALK
jgi:tetratricopeptide (TPR) repeat protein